MENYPIQQYLDGRISKNLKIVSPGLEGITAGNICQLVV